MVQRSVIVEHGALNTWLFSFPFQKSMLMPVKGIKDMVSSKEDRYQEWSRNAHILGVCTEVVGVESDFTERKL